MKRKIEQVCGVLIHALLVTQIVESWFAKSLTLANYAGMAVTAFISAAILVSDAIRSRPGTTVINNTNLVAKDDAVKFGIYTNNN